MAVPDYQTLMLPLLRHAAERGGETHIGALVDEIANEMKLTTEDLAALIPSGGQTLLLNRLPGQNRICNARELSRVPGMVIFESLREAQNCSEKD